MPRTNRSAVVLLAATGPLAAPALGQASEPHIFVANNGNLEGSLTSMRVEANGALTFVDRVITGSRTSTSQPCPGCNTTAIDLTPDGRFLASTHASGNFDENIIVYSVGAGGSLGVVETLLLPQGGLDIAWVRDDLLAVCVTDLSGPNVIRLYAFDDQTNTLSPTDSISAGSFLTSVAVHPNRQWIFANDSFANTVRQFTVTGDQIDLTATVGIPVFGTALKISPDGRFLYASGGISAGGNAFVGYEIDQSTGALTAMPGSPFTSPGQSPKGFAITPDGAYLYVSHGTDATIRAFRIDPESGVPTSLGTGFDVGLQGTLQGMDTLRGRMFALDNSTALDGLVGVYSFAIDALNGDLTPAPGPPPVPFVTQGISPNDVVAWAGIRCDADINGDGSLNFFDVLDFVDLYNNQNPAADLSPPQGVFNIFDITAYLALYNDGCP